MPVYNVEKFLPRCVDSILNQTFEDFELILIDDGSPDKCPQICDVYAEKDSRVKVIHQRNAGVSAARNRGMEISNGEYIGFVDSDDYIDPSMYELMIKAMETNSSDIVVCGYDYVDEKGKKSREYVNIKSGEFTQKQILAQLFDMPPSIRLGVCNKFFKKNLLHTIEFSEKIKGAEDAEVLCNYLKKVKKAFVINKPLYRNCERVGSATRGGLNADSVIPALNIYKKMWEYINEKYPELNYHCQAYFLDACLLNYGIYYDNLRGKDRIRFRREIRKRVLRTLPSVLFNDEIYWKTRCMYWIFGIFGRSK